MKTGVLYCKKCNIPVIFSAVRMEKALPKSEQSNINFSLKQGGSLHLWRSGCRLAIAPFLGVLP